MAHAEAVEQQAPPRREERTAMERSGQAAAPERQQESPPASGQSQAGAGPSPRPARSGGFRLVALLGAAVLVLLGVLYWLHSRHYEDTDDAQVDGHIHPISARISGTVLAINPEAEANRFVAAGTPLVDIDPADYRAAVASAQAEADRLRATAAASGADVPVQSANAIGQLHAAEATVDQAHRAVETERANLESARARVAEAQATYARAEADRERYANLLDKQEISRSEYDRRLAEAHTSLAALEAAKSDVVAAGARVAQAQGALAQQEANLTRARTAPQQIAEVRARFGSASADLARAEAQLETARLNLSYCHIVAPVAGIIGRKSVESGQRVQPGQEMLTLVQLDDIWVTANFKETQLRLMHAGQPAEIHVDAYGITLPGHVQSIAAATGAVSSLLPPENASGNFVKVVQRIPVRLALDRGQDPNHRLVPGMSVDATVTVR
jgi:membrane fusion protein (multidrug efflux system)